MYIVHVNNPHPFDLKAELQSRGNINNLKWLHNAELCSPVSGCMSTLYLSGMGNLERDDTAAERAFPFVQGNLLIAMFSEDVLLIYFVPLSVLKGRRSSMFTCVTRGDYF